MPFIIATIPLIHIKVFHQRTIHGGVIEFFYFNEKIYMKKIKCHLFMVKLNTILISQYAN